MTETTTEPTNASARPLTDVNVDNLTELHANLLEVSMEDDYAPLARRRALNAAVALDSFRQLVVKSQSDASLAAIRRSIG